MFVFILIVTTNYNISFMQWNCIILCVVQTLWNEIMLYGMSEIILYYIIWSYTIYSKTNWPYPKQLIDDSNTKHYFDEIVLNHSKSLFCTLIVNGTKQSNKVNTRESRASGPQQRAVHTADQTQTIKYPGGG